MSEAFGTETGLTYDDVLLLPGETDVIPSEVDTTTRLTREITLRVPLVSAAMDTVTEARMAIAMARQGGIGVLHRNLSIDDQAYQVDLVKRTQTGIITNPITIGPKATPRRARRDLRSLPRLRPARRRRGPDAAGHHHQPRPALRARRGVGHHDRRRDHDQCPAGHRLGRASAARTRPGCCASTSSRRLPLVDADGRLGGLITVKDFVKSEQFPLAVQGRVRPAARRLPPSATSVTPGSARPRSSRPASTSSSPDVANGHARLMLDMIRQLKSDPAIRHVQVIGGNIATRAGAQALSTPAPTASRSGSGRARSARPAWSPASASRRSRRSTRRPWRAGRPAFPSIGDGGLQYSGDIAKALVAGADTVMLGSLLAGCEESPGELIFVNGKQFKAYRGMGSLGAMASRGQEVLLQGPLLPGRRRRATTRSSPRASRARSPTAVRSSAVAHQLVGGLHQSMFYVGARTIPELQERGQFIRITAAGLKESHPHDVQMTAEAPNYHGR